MRTALFILVALSLALSTFAQTPCFARIEAAARTTEAGRWMIGDTTYQIYDLTVTNAGTCTLTRIVGFFSAREGTITEGWNYDLTSGLITGYGGTLAVGQTFTGAGFVVANSTGVSLALDRPGCDQATCASAPTGAPTTTPTLKPMTTEPRPTGTGTQGSPAPANCPVTLSQTRSTDEDGVFTYQITIKNTGAADVVTPVFFIKESSGKSVMILSTEGLVTYASTVVGQILVSLPPNTVIASGASYTAASYTTNGTTTLLELSSCVAYGGASTPSPTTAPTSAPTSSTGTCTVTPVVTRDSSYSWTDATSGKTAYVYRLTITNAGPCALKDYALSFGNLGDATIVSSWNLEGTRGGYLVTGYGETLAAGASYNGAGLIIAGAGDNIVGLAYGSNCSC